MNVLDASAGAPPVLVQSLLVLAERQGTRAAVMQGDQVVSWALLGERVRRTASRLAEAGVTPSSRVLICSEASSSWVESYFAAHLLGAVAVPVDTDSSATLLRAIAERARPVVAITSQPREVPGVRLLHPAEFDLERASEWDGPPPQPQQPADLLFTTGTTGRAKAVQLSHSNISHAARNTATFLQQAATDVELVAVPPSHSFGLGRLRCMALCGNAVVLQGGLRSPADLLNELTRRRATGLAMVPAGLSLLRRLTKDLLGEAQDHLRYLELGSMALPVEVRDWLLRLLPNTRICHHYGLTEASRAAFVVVGSAESLAGSIGRASPNVTITVRDDQGHLVAPGVAGELWVEGGMVMQGYLDEPELTARALVQGQLRTGDLGRADPEGNLFLLGRTNDLINVGGFKVAPDEVEKLLCGLEGVQEAACIGVPDPSRLSGERVHACVVASREVSLQEALAHLRQAELEAYKLPVSLERVTSLPRSPSGKLLRRELRDARQNGSQPRTPSGKP